MKVSGGRLLPGLALTVLGTGGNYADLARTPTGPYLVRELRVPRGFRAAVAAEGMRPFSITCHRIYLGQRPAPSQASELDAR